MTDLIDEMTEWSSGALTKEDGNKRPKRKPRSAFEIIGIEKKKDMNDYSKNVIDFLMMCRCMSWGSTYKTLVVMQSRAIMSIHIGRPLRKKEIVHHIDGNASNNCLSNLRLFSSNSEHVKYHSDISTDHKSRSSVYSKPKK